MGRTVETLTLRQQEFARLYFLHRIAAKAARLAGYSSRGRSAAVIGSRLLRHPGVRDAIDLARYEAQRRGQLAMIRDYEAARQAGNTSASIGRLGVLGRAAGALW